MRIANTYLNLRYSRIRLLNLLWGDSKGPEPWRCVSLMVMRERLASVRCGLVFLLYIAYEENSLL